jgi:hypothetical protein
VALMAGWTFIPTNRCLTAAITYGTGAGTVVAGYPLTNLSDPAHWMQNRTTPNLGVVLWQIDLGVVPHSNTDAEYLIGGCGVVNHNWDGATVDIRYGNATFASATSVDGCPFVLTASRGNPNFLHTFTAKSTRYWHVSITVDAPNPTIVGNIILGPTFDLGDPLRAPQFVSVPYTEPLVTAGGYEMTTQLTEPIDTKVVTFANISTLGENLVWNKDSSGNSGSPFVDYNTVWRHWRHLRQQDISSSSAVYTGVSAAGGLVPIIYHEGTARGLSTAGRPAFYGFCRPTLNETAVRQSSTVVMTIRDAMPKGPDVQPAI